MSKIHPEKDEKLSKLEKKNVQGIDGGYAWVVLVAAFLMSFIFDGILYAWGVILQPIRDTFNETNERANLLSALNTGFSFSSGPIASGLCKQYGCRAVAIGAGFITGLMYFVSIYAPSVNIMLITFGVVGGLSTGVTYLSSLIIIAEYFDKKRGIATGLTMAGSGVGAFVFAPVIQKITDKFDWKFSMVFCACVITQSCICGAIFRPLKPKENHSSNESKLVQTVSLNEASPACYKKLPCYQLVIDIVKETLDFKLLFQNWRFLVLTISNFFILVGYFTPYIFIPEIAQKNNIQNGSFILSIIGIVNIPCRIIYGIIADSKFISPIHLNAFSIGIATITLFLFPALQYHFYSQAIFAVFFAIGVAGVNSLPTTFLCELVGIEKFPNAQGIFYIAGGLGCFIGPFLGGYIADKYGMINGYYFSGVFFFIGFTLATIVSVGTIFKAFKSRKTDEELNELNK